MKFRLKNPKVNPIKSYVNVNTAENASQNNRDVGRAENPFIEINFPDRSAH